MIQEILKKISKIFSPFQSERGDTSWIALLAGSAILISVVVGVAFKADIITLSREGNVTQVHFFDQELAPSDSDEITGMGNVSGGEGESDIPGEDKSPSEEPWYKRASDWVGDKAKKASDWVSDKAEDAKDWVIDKAKKVADWTGNQIDKAIDWWKNKAWPWLKGLPGRIADWWAQLPGWLKGVLIGLGVAALATLIVVIICLTGGLAIPVIALIVGALAAIGAGGLYGLHTDINPDLDFNFWHALEWSVFGWISGFLGTGGLAKLAPEFAKAGIGQILTKAAARFGATNIGTILFTHFTEDRMPTVQELLIYAGCAVASGLALDTASNLIYKALSRYNKGGQWAWKFLGKIPLVDKASAWLRNHQMVPTLLQNEMVKQVISVGERIGVLPGIIGVGASLIGSMEGPKLFIQESTEQIIEFIAKIVGG